MNIVKKAVRIGNGAAVYVPLEYAGKELVVVLPQKSSDLKKRLLNSLIEFMPNILGIYIFGSHARNEQTPLSDLDILIITDKKDLEIKKSIEKTPGLEHLDLRVMPLKSVKKSIEKTPVLIIPILKEAETIINPSLLNELKDSKIDYRKFTWHFDEMKRSIKIIKSFLEVDPIEISPVHIYSIIMRLKICSLIDSLLHNTNFTNKSLLSLLLKYQIQKNEIEKFISIYRKVRDNKSDLEKDLSYQKITKEEIQKLLFILEDYMKKLENETKKKIGKRN